MSSAASGLGRFDVKKYQPDGGFRGLGVVNLITTLIVAGLILGFVAHFIGQYFYLILLFPILIGCALGIIGGRMVKAGHIRNPWLGALAGFLGGVFAMGVMYYSDFQTYKTQMVEKVPEIAELSALSEADLTAAASDAKDPKTFIAAVRATRSFPAFMDFEAQQGVEISNHGSKGMNLGYYGTYIYWLVEVLIVAGVTLAMVRDEAAVPYCVACAKWKAPRTLGGMTGDIGMARMGVESGDLAQLAGGLPNAAAESSIMLYGSVCPACNGAQSTVEVKLEEWTKTKDGKTQKKTLAHASWPGEALTVIEQLCNPPAPPATEVTAQA